MEKYLRIHGDNIVECERILNLIIKGLNIKSKERGFASKACPSIKITTVANDELYFELFPGFNKNTSDRWNSNILDILKAKGSFLDETPDALLTVVENNQEKILIAIEFCSALQAGNQAWQRSGRAYSTSRTKVCPYLYIVDFVKYELESTTRNRKALRFPNPAVPFSYLTHSKNLSSPVLQAYFCSEEFQPTYDPILARFHTSIFAEADVSEYLIKLIYNADTRSCVNRLFAKNYEMVEFIANTSSPSSKNNFTTAEWRDIHIKNLNMLDAVNNIARFNHKKKISAKSVVGRVVEFNNLVEKYSIGIASKDLPFGLIPGKVRDTFIDELIDLYGSSFTSVLTSFKSNEDLIVCTAKGFKPRGDDNRPDRGLLPLISMLTNENVEILTFLYGPITASSLHLFDTDINALIHKNGFWKSFIALSNLVIIDSPVIASSSRHAVRVFNSSTIKKSFLAPKSTTPSICVSTTPVHYSENDVDTLMHTMFSYLIPDCFEGLCNPPGGDWSGLSILDKRAPLGREYRWLSLPRVSSNGKRPDHVVTLHSLTSKPIILIAESKEKGKDLEPDIGPQLKEYLRYLFDFYPSVERPMPSTNWSISSTSLYIKDYYCVSIGCFLYTEGLDLDSLNTTRKCDILIAFKPDPISKYWHVLIKGYSRVGVELEKYFKRALLANITPLNIFKLI